MKNEEKIRKYLDGELTGEELQKFEAEINNSPELRKMITLYRSALNQYKELSNINIENSYFVNILPEFYERIKKQKTFKLNQAFALSSVIVIMVSLLVIFVFNKEQPTNEIVMQEIETEELSSYYNDNSRNYTTLEMAGEVPTEYDSVFNAMISEELNINGNSAEYIADVTSNSFFNILDELSEEEIDGIYSSLISKKFY